MSVDNPGIRMVLRAPQVLRVLVSSQVGRLPTASGPLALLLFARQSLSLTTAGLLVAAYTAGMAVGTPLLARAVDRWRQPPVLWGSAVLSGLGFGAVALSGGHLAGAMVGAAVAGLGTPPLEACLRTLWPGMLPPTAVPTAYTLDIAVQEVIFVVGPLVTVLAVTVGGPSAGLAAAALAQLVGTAAYATAPAVREWRGVPAARHWAGPLRVPRFTVMVAAVIGVGAAVGSIAVAVTGYAEAAGDRRLSGWLLAAQAAGALAGGLLYTRARPGGPGRLPLLATALSLGYLPLLLAPGPLPMAGLLVVSGLALPPVLTAVFLAAERLAEPGTVAEAFAWVATAFVIGSAAGSALAGPLVSAGLRYGLAVAPGAALLGALVLWGVSAGERTGGVRDGDPSRAHQHAAGHDAARS
ncbi:Predicted arabinose efflux permease, MFS family [Micromonospora citrea]|uniref:Predicted arabinose efflux permease, MFS family n=1 Tax=Micromonospora citrea TaxID=47855 RepID=A0A1C6VUT1_9ACTN|nr:MFS transporter [Micromonospora citrea]SCL70108.1 Predicted arabinose efflux permease, MFS family [Micromonospora citrea]